MLKKLLVLAAPVLGVLASTAPAYADNPCLDGRACRPMPVDPPPAVTADPDPPPTTAPAPTPAPAPAPEPEPAPVAEPPAAPAADVPAPPAPPARDVPEGSEGGTSTAASKPAGVGRDTSTAASTPGVSSPATPAPAAAPSAAPGAERTAPVPVAAPGELVPAGALSSPATPREVVRPPLGSSLQRTGVAGMLVFASGVIAAFASRRRGITAALAAESPTDDGSATSDFSGPVVEPWIADVEHYLEIAAAFSASDRDTVRPDAR